MLRLLIFFLISLPAFARTTVMPQSGFQDNMWQQSQIMHIQTQQQLQAQDQYRRQLLQQDQQRQIERLEDQQRQLEYLQQSDIWHQHAQQLRLLSYPPKPRKLSKAKNDK